MVYRLPFEFPGIVGSVQRPIITSAPAHGLMDRLFAGPTNDEKAQGLRFVSSKAKFYSDLTVSSGEVARLRLRGGCDFSGDTHLGTIADQIFPTLAYRIADPAELNGLSNVSWVKIYDYYWHTDNPTGLVDSIPECLGGRYPGE